MARRLEVPLFPLPSVVHFPKTRLRLHIFEARYRQMIQDLLELPEELRWIGMATLSEPNSSSVYRSGTAGLLADVEPLPDGRFNVVLEGDFRFVIEQETSGDAPYRQAFVAEVEEGLSKLSSERFQQLAPICEKLLQEMERPFEIEGELFQELTGPDSEASDLHTLINELAANLNITTELKLKLLTLDLDERAEQVLEVLKDRCAKLDQLRPFRWLAQNPSLN